jgi:hypothetical protein
MGLIMILHLVMCVYLVRINHGLLSFLSTTYIHYFPYVYWNRLLEGLFLDSQFREI